MVQSALSYITRHTLDDPGKLTNCKSSQHYYNMPRQYTVVFRAVKTRTVRESDYSPAVELSEQKDKLVTENWRD